MKLDEAAASSPASAPRPDDRLHASSKLRPTSIDFLIAALSPGLIIGMICCLVFFLILITCRGDFTGRLMYILGLYTFASVMIARIAIEQSRAAAWTYASILGLATLLVTLRFVSFDGIFSLLAIPLVVGFLLLIGFLADRITFDCTCMEEKEDRSGVGLLQSLGLLSNPEQTKRRHNPGVWVLYFALLAIPLFGLGQLAMPAYANESHRAAWAFLFGYLFFALSLLVSTSFLGLRRYLRKRQVAMPASISAIWVAGGTAAVGLLLAIIASLPLPSGALGVADLPFRIQTATQFPPNRWGWGNEGTQQDAPGAAKTAGHQEKREASAERKGGSQPASARKKSSGASEKRPNPTSAEKSNASPPPSTSSPTIQLSGGIGNLLRWLVSLFLLIVIVYCAIRFRRELREAWLEVLAWWSQLFAREGVKEARAETLTEIPSLSQKMLRSFRSYLNPFASTTERWRADQIVRHTFEAVEAWGSERQVIRSVDETPEEYLRRLASRFPEQTDSFLRLMQLYNRLAYANGEIDRSEVKRLSMLWDELQRIT